MKYSELTARRKKLLKKKKKMMTPLETMDEPLNTDVAL